MEEVNQNSSTRAQFLAFVFRPFWIFINLPSMLSPVAAEIFKADLSVDAFVLWSGVNTLIMLVRFFQEGVVVGPFRRMVGTLSLAAPQLLSFAIAVGVVMAVCAEVENNLFGVFNEVYDTIFITFVSVFDSFANGRGFQGRRAAEVEDGSIYDVASQFFASDEYGRELSEAMSGTGMPMPAGISPIASDATEHTRTQEQSGSSIFESSPTGYIMMYIISSCVRAPTPLRPACCAQSPCHSLAARWLCTGAAGLKMAACVGSACAAGPDGSPSACMCVFARAHPAGSVSSSCSHSSSSPSW